MIRYDYVKTRRENLKPYPENTKGLTRFFMKAFTRINVWVYRASKGRWLNTFHGGFPICLVTTR